MLYRSIYIGNSAYLKLKDKQLKVTDPETKEEKGSVPIEDIGLLMLDHYQITLSHQLIQELMKNNVILISCDERHLPLAGMLPFSGNSLFSERVKTQIEVSEPLKKQLWKQTIECKIQNQLKVLEQLDKYASPMYEYLKQVKSGDTTNMEGIAAQHYWKYLIDNDFLRDRLGDYPNPFFNFGYGVLLSIMARALVDTGLLLVLGIFHRNKYNPYCLASDIMEPYRPIVDLLVMKWLQLHPEKQNLDKESKTFLLQIATQDVNIEKLVRPLIVGVKMTASSLLKCYTGEKRQISYPEL
ncbi:type II CRISPR-associated endonuclease Cas1 [uncultured Capnocytophaga sp.]|uniref:type II CRISPR-associated endonuclease Cas1 n=1 Tax=uncultured Capnocytophaga sp. TaxID=159273 RepID=UPI00261E83AD|nr:type II CRISPR-associated endonuclease Cas1 [uncultured Capnocytophaga sp.]